MNPQSSTQAFCETTHYADVAAVITAMTDGEKSFLADSLKAVLADDCISQIVLCVEKHNQWLETTLSSYLTDPRLIIVKLPMMSPGSTRNHALQYVTMPWVAYCDGDDVWCQGKTATQRKFADENACDFVAVDHYLTDEQGKIRAFAMAKHLPMTSSWMVRTQAMRQHPFNESITSVEDGEWWVRTTHSVKKARCPRMLLRYRVRAESFSSAKPSKRRKAKIIAVAKWPIVSWFVLGATGCLWYLNRHNHYVHD